MASAPIDYSALADQARKTPTTTTGGGIDYSALADQARSTPPTLTTGEKTASGEDTTQPQGFASSLWDKINPVNVASGLWDFMKAAIPHLAVGDTQGKFPDLKSEHDFFAEIGQHIKNGEISTASNKVAGAIVPGLSQAEQQYHQGDTSGAIGTGLGSLAQLYLMKKLGDLGVGGAKMAAESSSSALVKSDPVKDLVPVYGPTDPRFPERAPTAIADINHSAGPVTSNEHLASISPDYKAGQALQDNRAVWKQWMDRADNEHLVARPNSILASTVNSLKEMANPSQRAALLSETAHKLAQEPLTAKRLEALLEEKNGELKGFYSKSDADKSAAVQAGAVSGRSQALLEAQARAIRNELYKLLDPENDGAGPREVQQRYGGIKMLVDEASNGPTRNRIYAETQGSPLSKAGRTGAATLSLPGSVLEGRVEEGVKRLLHPFTGISDPLIARAFRNGPEYKPLPMPDSAEYPTAAYSRRITSGDIITPQPADTSGSYYNERNNPMTQPTRVLLNASNYPSYGSEGTGGVIVPDIIGSSSRGEGTPHRLLAAPAPGEGLGKQDLTLPREREILAGGTSGTPHGWLPSAPGQTASTVNEPAHIISKRGEAIPNTPQALQGRPLTVPKLEQYLHDAGWNGSEDHISQAAINKARAAAVRDGYSVVLPK